MEWLTSRENTIHSTGKKVQQLDFKTGEIINTHDSIACAARSVGLNSATCIKCVCKTCVSYLSLSTKVSVNQVVS